MMYPDDESHGDARERIEKNSMVPDELEMQVARAVLAEEQVADRDRTIDALVAALEEALPWLPYGPGKNDAIREQVKAALALARGGK
jgi:hypothetical protein